MKMLNNFTTNEEFKILQQMHDDMPEWNEEPVAQKIQTLLTASKAQNPTFQARAENARLIMLANSQELEMIADALGVKTN